MRIYRTAATLVALLLFDGLSISAANAASTDSVSYQYYPDGRLHTITYANGTVITYVYDAAGNRQTVTTTCSGSGC